MFTLSAARTARFDWLVRVSGAQGIRHAGNTAQGWRRGEGTQSELDAQADLTLVKRLVQRGGRVAIFCAMLAIEQGEKVGLKPRNGEHEHSRRLAHARGAECEQVEGDAEA